MNGGDLIGEVLQAQQVKQLFTLCGGHISPILLGAKRRGIRVVDVRHEANAVFAADAVARLTGIPGVAAVTAGPGLTNTITALKNAQLAQSPVVLLGGAAATALRGRGSLQDIDQMRLIEPHVKLALPVTRVRDLAPAVHKAFDVARSGTPGPVFVECPIDLLYDEELIKSWYTGKSGGKSAGERALAWYLRHHVDGLFAGADKTGAPIVTPARYPRASSEKVKKAADKLARAECPIMIIGSQALALADHAQEIARAVEALDIPVYLSGMARGLLGAGHRLHQRHKRRDALKEADVVILAGVPCDFRLDYGAHIKKKSFLIGVGRRSADVFKNRIPNLAVHADAGEFLCALAGADTAAKAEGGGDTREAWLSSLQARDKVRDAEIHAQAVAPTDFINPVHLCQRIEAQLDEDSVLVADGGDFVATASYIVKPRRPLSWLDPGVFGTLGVGAGFATGAQLVRPKAQVWILYGDGSVGYSLAEFDTFVRHQLPVIAVVGNDACWTQIARDQIEILGDDVGVMLRRTDYHLVAEGFGGKGLLLDDPAQIDSVLAEAVALSNAGHPVLINAMIGKTDFRKGSISM